MNQWGPAISGKHGSPPAPFIKAAGVPGRLSSFAGLVTVVLLILTAMSCTLLLPGEYRNFWVLEYPSREPYQVKTRLMHSSLHAEIFLERGEFAPASTILALADTIDNRIYPELIKAFDDPGDRDGNGKLILVLMDIRDGFGDNSSSYVAGLFLEKDLDGGLLSNGGEIIYLDVRPGLEFQGSEEIFISTAAHEFFHLIDHSMGNERETWLSESLALYAERLFHGGALPFRLEEFSIADPAEGVEPGDTPIAQGRHFYSWQGGPSDYASAHLFMTWAEALSPDIAGSIYRQPALDDEMFLSLLSGAEAWHTLSSPMDIFRNWHVTNALAAAGYGGDGSGWSAAYLYADNPEVVTAISGAPIFASPEHYSGREMLLAPGDGLLIRGHTATTGEPPSARGTHIQYWGFSANDPDRLYGLGEDPMAREFLLVFNANPDNQASDESTGTLPAAALID